jgi:hypothetical protein
MLFLILKILKIQLKNIYIVMPLNYLSKNIEDFFLIFKNVDYLTDDGFIFQQIRNQSYNQFSYFKEAVSAGSANAFTPDTLLEINITCDNIKDIYIRIYLKLQRLVADIGGVTNFFCFY